MSKRKCGTCEQDIIVDRHNLDDIAFYNNRYHHVDCLLDKANNGIKSGKRISNWEKLLNRIPELKEKAKQKIKHSIIRDEFNEYLLNHYDVITISNRFWSAIEDIGNGIYRNKKCRKTDMETIFNAWSFYQNNLDKINMNNKEKHRGPTTDGQRINYDLAIIVQHIGDYQKNITATKEESARAEEHIEKQNKINYKELYSQSNNQGASNDILDLMDEIF